VVRKAEPEGSEGVADIVRADQSQPRLSFRYLHLLKPQRSLTPSATLHASSSAVKLESECLTMSNTAYAVVQPSRLRRAPTSCPRDYLGTLLPCSSCIRIFGSDTFSFPCTLNKSYIYVNDRHISAGEALKSSYTLAMHAIGSSP
jgi:hypothetical protein